MVTHEGHRERISQKLESGAKLQDHEYLEMLLFNALPRVNTNPIAHALIDNFGSLRGVLDAPVEELVKVAGVGRNAARYLRNIGTIAAIAYKVDGSAVYLRNYGDFLPFAASRLRGKREEVLEFYFCESNGKVKRIYTVTNNEQHGVAMERQELSKMIADTKAFGLVVAHNHLSGGSAPSEADDIFTREAQVLCSAHGIILLDHCIYAADNDVYSFYSSGRIDEIIKNYSFNKLVNGDR